MDVLTYLISQPEAAVAVFLVSFVAGLLTVALIGGLAR